MESCSSKRRRTTHNGIIDTSQTDGSGVCTIFDMRDDNLVAIAGYLPKTSRAMLAVALTASPLSFRECGWKRELSRASKAIIAGVYMHKESRNWNEISLSGSFDTLIEGIYQEDARGGENTLPTLRNGKKYPNNGYYENLFKHYLGLQLRDAYIGHWDVLDFVDIGKSLASRISDDDLGAILVCIDAKNKLKHLKLTHCTDIIGQGLEPLKCSTTLEKIGIGFVWDHEVPLVIDEAKLSEDVLFGIIHDILSTPDNSLWRVKLPMVLFNDGNPKEALAQFMGEHETIILNNSSMCIYVWGERENQQHFGGAGRFDGVDGDEVLSSKRKLLHYICDLDTTDYVDMCPRCIDHYKRFHNFTVCKDCEDIRCFECEDIQWCVGCETGVCGDCMDTSNNPVLYCEGESHTHQEPYCLDCWVGKYRNGTNDDCDLCKSMIYHRLTTAEQAEIDLERREAELNRLRREVQVLEEILRERNAH